MKHPKTPIAWVETRVLNNGQKGWCAVIKLDGFVMKYCHGLTKRQALRIAVTRYRREVVRRVMLELHQ